MLSFRDYLEDVRHDRFFSYTKINHGFWERLIRVRHLTGGTLEASPSEAEAFDSQTGSPCFLASGFAKELLGLLGTMGSMPGDLRFARSPYAWPACRRILGVPFTGLSEVQAVIREYIPPVREEDGIFWKTATIDGSIAEFYRALQTKRVALVGPHWLRHFGSFAGWSDFTFLQIDERAARCQRNEILPRVSAFAGASGGKPPVILFQASTLATWLVLPSWHGSTGGASIEGGFHDQYRRSILIGTPGRKLTAR
jgi:hypothetical protein